MEGIPKKIGEEISSGSERSVHKHEKDPENKVITHEGTIRPESIKEMFYTQRILSSLYPDHFPKFPEAIVDAHGFGYVTRERISETFRTRFARSVTEAFSRTDGLHSFESNKAYGRDEYSRVFQKIKYRLAELGIELSFDYTNHNNFMKSKETGLWNYVDVPMARKFPSSTEFAANAKSLEPPFDPDSVKAVTSSLERIETLQTQTINNFVNDIKDSQVLDTSLTYKGETILLTGAEAKELPSAIAKLKEVFTTTPDLIEEQLLAEYLTVREIVDSLYGFLAFDHKSGDKADVHEISASRYDIKSIKWPMERLLKNLKEGEAGQQPPSSE